MATPSPSDDLPGDDPLYDDSPITTLRPDIDPGPDLYVYRFRGPQHEDQVHILAPTLELALRYYRDDGLLAVRQGGSVEPWRLKEPEAMYRMGPILRIEGQVYPF